MSTCPWSSSPPWPCSSCATRPGALAFYALLHLIIKFQFRLKCPPLFSHCFNCIAFDILLSNLIGQTDLDRLFSVSVSPFMYYMSILPTIKLLNWKNPNAKCVSLSRFIIFTHHMSLTGSVLIKIQRNNLTRDLFKHFSFRAISPPSAHISHITSLIFFKISKKPITGKYAN